MQDAGSLARAGALIKSVESRLEDLHSSIRERNLAAARDKATSFVRALGFVLNFDDVTPKETSRPMRPLLCDRLIKFSPTRLRGFDHMLHMMVSSRLRPTRTDYSRFKGMALGSGLGARIFFLINPGHVYALKEHASSDRAGLVVLDADDIQQILNAVSPRAVLNRTISHYIDIDDIQPYDYYGEARGQMFFGRQKQLKRIMTRPERSFAVFGGRRIGKTSLLKKLQTELNRDSSNSAIFLSAQGLQSNVDLCKKIIDVMLGPRFDPQARARATQLDYFAGFAKNFILRSGKRWTILIDEIDDFVYRDRERRHEVMATLRALDSELREACRFVFAGFRLSYESLLSHYSPARNFLDPIVLQALDPESARELVLVPIEDDLGYHFADPDVADRVLDYASYHPCHIQRFCNLLLKHVHSQNRHTISENDIDDVFHDPEFRDGLLETFYWNTTPSQKLIIYLFLDADRFTIDDAYSALVKRVPSCQMSEVMNDLMRLVTFGHLNKAGKTYVFSHAMFPRIVKEAQSVNVVIRGLLRELKQRQKRRG